MKTQVNTDVHAEGRESLSARVGATDEAATLDQAVRGAADKLAGIIDSQFGRLASSDRSPVKPAAE